MCICEGTAPRALDVPHLVGSPPYFPKASRVAIPRNACKTSSNRDCCNPRLLELRAVVSCGRLAALQFAVRLAHVQASRSSFQSHATELLRLRRRRDGCTAFPLATSAAPSVSFRSGRAGGVSIDPAGSTADTSQRWARCRAGRSAGIVVIRQSRRTCQGLHLNFLCACGLGTEGPAWPTWGAKQLWSRATLNGRDGSRAADCGLPASVRLPSVDA